MGIRDYFNKSKIEYTSSEKTIDALVEMLELLPPPVPAEHHTTHETGGDDEVTGLGGGGVALGETSTTAYRGDRGKTAYDHSQVVAGNPHGTKSTEVFSVPGALTVVAGVSRLFFPVAATIASVWLACDAAPTGAAILCDVHKDGTTIFTTQGNRPTIADAGYASTAAAVPDVQSVAAGSYLTVDVDQIGSTIAGSDLTVTVLYTWA